MSTSDVSRITVLLAMFFNFFVENFSIPPMSSDTKLNIRMFSPVTQMGIYETDFYGSLCGKMKFMYRERYLAKRTRQRADRNANATRLPHGVVNDRQQTAIPYLIETVNLNTIVVLHTTCVKHFICICEQG